MMTCDDDQLIIGKKMNNQCSVRMLYEYFVVNETGIEKSKLDEWEHRRNIVQEQRVLIASQRHEEWPMKRKITFKS